MILKYSIISILLLFFLTPTANAQQLTSSPDARLNSAISRQGVSLDDTSKARISTKCQIAQSRLVTSRQLTDAAIQKRILVYTNIQKELQAIELRMMRQGVDSSEMDLLIGKIQQSLDNFTLEADNYGLVLSDLIFVDCKNKPEQFYAGLVDLRQQRAKLNNAAKQIKDVVEEANTSTFIPLKKRLTT